MTPSTSESPVAFSIRALPVRQPLGQFYIGSIAAQRLCDISYFDVRRMLKERDIETYLGIQRPLNSQRVTELQAYVRTFDACFPTSVILAVDARAAEYDDNTGTLTLRNDPNPPEGLDPIYYRHIARVLDGQHRIAGLFGYDGPDFEVNVSIFVDIDIEDQAYIFSTVNLAQTKVNRSLAYDLAELSKARSPQRTCHNVAVALDKTQQSPFFQRIKRLGTATPGRSGERITQATFVESLMPFISEDPMRDRDLLRRGRSPEWQTASGKTPFRRFFVNGEDLVIAEIIMRFFAAVRARWPSAWNSEEKGAMLSRTNGFRAFMRILRKLYPVLEIERPSESDFSKSLARVRLHDVDFTSDRFKPGGGGEVELYNLLADFLSLR